jgi:hypothetical protein
VSGFAILTESSLKIDELDVELHSASTDTIVDWGHQAKTFHSHYRIRPSMAPCSYPHQNCLPDNPGQK